MTTVNLTLSLSEREARLVATALQFRADKLRRWADRTVTQELTTLNSQSADFLGALSIAIEGACDSEHVIKADFEGHILT